MTEDDGSFTLYINNIPSQLNEEGLKQLFSEYGEVLSVLQPKNCSWAYISFSSYKEAELAMRHLDRAKPLELRIEVANKQNNSKKNIIQTNAPIEVPDFRVKTNIQVPEPRAPAPHILRNSMQRSTIIPQRPGPDIEYLYPAEVSSDTFDIYENPDNFYDSNLMWCRGQMRITQDGRRHICMGRGYTLYELPHRQNPNTVQYISQIYETRNPHVYQYGINQLDDEEICLFCKLPAKFQCYKCFGYYCSSSCQSKDWPRHQHLCKPMPKLVSCMDNIKISEEKFQQKSPINVAASSPDTTPRRPHKNPIADELVQRPRPDKTFMFPKPPEIVDTPKPNLISLHENSNKVINSPVINSSKTIDKQSPISSKCIPQAERPKSKDVENSVLKQTTYPISKQIKIPSPKQSDFSNSKMCEPIKSTNLNLSPSINKSIEKRLPQETIKTKMSLVDDSDFVFEKDTYLPPSGATVVIVSSLGNSTYWVQKLDDTVKLNEMMKELQNKVKNLSKAQPIVGKLYVLCFMGLWHRVKVNSTNPLNIQYIDYGEDNEPENTDFREIGEFEKYPPFARKVKFVTGPGFEEKYNLDEQIKIKAVSHEHHNGLLIVTSEKAEALKSALENSSVPKVQNSVIHLKNGVYRKELQGAEKTNSVQTIMAMLKVNSTGVLEIHTPLSNNVFTVTLIPLDTVEEFMDITQKMPQICEKSLIEIINYVPKIDEYVAGKRGNRDWIRGKVLSVGPPIKLAVCDEGRISNVQAVVPLPEKYFNFPAVAVTCEFVNATTKFMPGKQFDYTVESTNVINGKPVVEIQVIDENGSTNKAIIKQWIPTLEQKGLTCTKIKSGTEVCIITYKNQYSMYVRGLSAEYLEPFGRVIQDVAKYASNAKKLTSPPVKGEMIIAQYQEDNNFYRAIVNEIKGNDISISYVDFGNMEKTLLNHLYEIPEHLKQIPACIQHIILKDVPRDVPMKKELVDYLECLTANETALIMQYDENETSNEVILYDSTESVNNKIKTILIPSWEKVKPENENTCFMIDKMPITKLGKVGEVVDATVIHTVKPGVSYYMCISDFELVSHISVVMQEQINEYVKNNTNHYIPRDNELCLAPYQELYYRALCILSSKSVTTALVMLVDYGNILEVKHTEIRMMTKDFMEPRPLGAMCHINNLLPDSMQDDIPQLVNNRIEELIVENNTIKIKITGFNETDLEHAIEVEDVKKILKDENLI